MSFLRKKPRILHVIDHLDLGGAQSLLCDLVILLRKEGWDVEVASLHDRGPFAELLEKANVPLHILAEGRWPPVYLKNFLALRSRFDLFHFYLRGSHFLLQPLVWLLGEQPSLFHDQGSSDAQFRSCGDILMEATAYRGTTHTIAVCEQMKNFLLTYEGVDPTRISLIPNGVNVETFYPPSKEERDKARSTFGLSPGDWCVGTLGRMVYQKNQELFLRAAAAFFAQQKPLPEQVDGGVGQPLFLLAGDGPEQERLLALRDQLAKEYQCETLMQERFRFLGSIADRQQLLWALDLFMLPSRYEGLPLALLEALAVGLPIISSDIAGVSHVLASKEKEPLLGHLCQPDMLEAYLQSLSQEYQDWRQANLFVSNPTPEQDQVLLLRKEKVEARYQRVRTSFSAQKAAEQVAELYYRLLEL